MDLLSDALDAEKRVALVATRLDVEPVELQLVPITTGKLNHRHPSPEPQTPQQKRVTANPTSSSCATNGTCATFRHDSLPVPVSPPFRAQ
jgi:hypothetical protein